MSSSVGVVLMSSSCRQNKAGQHPARVKQIRRDRPSREMLEISVAQGDRSNPKEKQQQGERESSGMRERGGERESVNNRSPGNAFCFFVD